MGSFGHVNENFGSMKSEEITSMYTVSDYLSEERVALWILM